MENISRRKFLKLGGACAAGLGVAAVSKTAVAAQAVKYEKSSERLNAKNWAWASI